MARVKKKDQPYHQRFEDELMKAAREIWRNLNPERKLCKKNAEISPFLWRCSKCLDETQVIFTDHIKPVGLGKTLIEKLEILNCELSNLQPLCRACNNLKNTLDKKLIKESKNANT